MDQVDLMDSSQRSDSRIGLLLSAVHDGKTRKCYGDQGLLAKQKFDPVEVAVLGTGRDAFELHNVLPVGGRPRRRPSPPLRGSEPL